MSLILDQDETYEKNITHKSPYLVAYFALFMLVLGRSHHYLHQFFLITGNVLILL